MKITEKQLRKIIREELQDVTSDKMSILPPDVSPELFVKAFKMFHGGELQDKYVNRYNGRFDTGHWLRSLTAPDSYTGKSNLTQQETEEALKLLEMCIEGEQYDYGYWQIVQAIRNLFKKTSDNAIRDVGDTYFMTGSNLGVITHLLYAPWSTMTHDKISNLKNKITSDELQTQIDILNSLKAFTEPKQLSRSTILKLKKMATDPAGLLQAAQLYEML
jgi:hypothetical protein